ncbi:MAG TPA: NAD(P)/FAD-dependent oxidoreductase [bacterium]|nr:NAD(P)/FAD-dependent oxidoreductase [bacterium]
MERHRFDVAIIGAGPAGLMAALHIPAGLAAVVLEKGGRPGRKLLLSGAGQCNLTAAGEIGDFEHCYGDHGRWLRPALRNLTNHDLITFFERRGVPCALTPEGKYFPKSLRAADILDVLTAEIRRRGIALHRDRPVERIGVVDDRFVVHGGGDIYEAAAIIIATGGKSYPGTGSTGDGQGLAATLGHTVVPLRPALAPVIPVAHPLAPLAGNSCEEACLTILRGGKKVHTAAGPLLITHTGFSGPLILDNARRMEPGDTLRIAFTPARREEFLRDLIAASRGRGAIAVKNIVKDAGLTKNLREALIRHAGIDPDGRAAELDRVRFAALADAFCAFAVTVGALGGFETAMATAGGVALTEVDPKTMMSKIVPRLFFAGEVLDIDGDSGGYNLQAAFSTGALAGRSVIRS